MGISFDPATPGKDFSEVHGKIVDALVSAATAEYIGVLRNLYDVVTSIRQKARTQEQAAWLLWCEAVAYALADFFDSAHLHRQPEKDELTDLVAEVLGQSATHCAGAELTNATLADPTDLAMYRALREDWPTRVSQVAPDHGKDPEALRRLLDRCFARRFVDARVRGRDQYTAIEASLGGNIAADMQRFDEWQRYYDFLRWQVEEKPLFGQDEGGAALARMFVPLRCHWIEDEDDGEAASQFSSEYPTLAVIAMLNDTLEAWLDENDTEDLLRIVTGGPGSGKSSSAQMLAHRVAAAGRCNVLLVQLQGMDITAPIDGIVDQYIGLARAGQAAPHHNPIETLDHDHLPLLLIFDGLDEAAPPDRTGDDVARTFIANLRQRLRAAHLMARAVRLRALVLGRTTAADNAIDSIALPGHALLRAAPLCPLNEDRLNLSGTVELGFADNAPDEIELVDQRNQFWANYVAVSPDCPPKPPEGLFGATLDDLTIEPLLLYLLMYSGYIAKNWPKALENRNRVYEEIFRKVHQRDVHEKRLHIKDELKSEGDFFTLMECLGLAAWRGGGRTGSNQQFELLRDKIYAREYETRFANIDNADIDNVALQFYTQRPGGDQPGYAFIHKSFGEYLTARALINAAEKWTHQHAGHPDRIAADWLQLTGPQEITADIRHFMDDEARLRSGVDDPQKVARERIDELIPVVNHTLRDGFPAHVDLETGRDSSDVTWRQRESMQASAERALYFVIGSWSAVAFPTDTGTMQNGGGFPAGAIAIEWPDDNAANSLIDRALNDGQGRMNLRALNFKGSELSFALLVGADLSYASCRDLHLVAANMTNAIARFSDFSNALLIGSSCSSVDLSGANLTGAIFDRSDLMQAKLNNARLERTRFIRANLAKASLEGADITGADLRGANLSHAKGLTKSQLDQAVGSEDTILPEGLTRPAHWLPQPTEQGEDRPEPHDYEV